MHQPVYHRIHSLPSQEWLQKISTGRKYWPGENYRNWTPDNRLMGSVSEFAFQEVTGLPFKPGIDRGWDHEYWPPGADEPRTIDIKSFAAEPTVLAVPVSQTLKAHAYVLARCQIRAYPSNVRLPVWTVKFMGWCTANRLAQTHGIVPALRSKVDNYYIEIDDPEFYPMSVMLEHIVGHGRGPLFRPPHMEQTNAEQWARARRGSAA
jgi:hypothetical protein